MTRLEKIIEGMVRDPSKVAEFLDAGAGEFLPEPMPYCRSPKKEACAVAADAEEYVELPCRACILAWLSEEVEA